MADLQDQQVTLGGKPYTLRFSIRAILALKQRWGLKTEEEVAKRMARVKDESDLEEFVPILWAGLRTHHKDLTEDDVLTLLDDTGASGMEEMARAVEAAQPPDPQKGQRRTKSRARP